jgi:predicted permease
MDQKRMRFLRFSLREFIGLVIVAGISCSLGILISPPQHGAPLVASAIMFMFGGGSFIAGLVMGRLEPE